MTYERRVLIGKATVCEMTSLSPGHIDRLEATGKFPRRVRLTDGRVAWVLSEVLEWIKARMSQRRG